MTQVSAAGAAPLAEFRADVISGLSTPQKTLSARWLYDEYGSKLFEQITELPEYYPTRTETRILKANVGHIAQFAGQRAVLIEYGAGSAIKTELLLSRLPAIRHYVPIDISAEFLDETCRRVRRRFPELRTSAVVADFNARVDLSMYASESGGVAFFPGSTIGNLDATESTAFLRNMREHVGEWGAAIIGVDLKKSPSILIPAYDDADGVTAAFNLNLLRRMNNELGADFKLSEFEHLARWNERDSAVEMHLVSCRTQVVTIGTKAFLFEQGETIHTESSRKFEIEEFANLARGCGWRAAEVWTDPDRLFAVFGLR
jgi:dimethylhistidine N-methyltransferase